MRTQTFDVPPQEVRITFFLTKQIFPEDIFSALQNLYFKIKTFFFLGCFK